MKVLQAFGFTADDVYKVLGIGGRQEFALDHIVTLTGLYTTLKDGATTKEQIMRDIDVVDATPARVTGSISQRAAATGPAQTAPKTNPAADAALASEAKRVADKRAADAKADADAEAAKAQADQEARRQAEIAATNEATRQEAEASAEEPDAPPAQDDNTGIATDPAALDAYYDAILADLLDDMPVDIVQSSHAAQIAAI